MGEAECSTKKGIFGVVYLDIPRLDRYSQIYSLRSSSDAASECYNNLLNLVQDGRAGFKCVEAVGRIIIRGPYPSSDAIIYMHLQL